MISQFGRVSVSALLFMKVAAGPLWSQTPPRLSPLATEPDWPSLAAFSATMTKETFDQVVNAIYLDGVAKSPPPWTEDADGLSIDTAPGQPRLRVEFQKPGGPAKAAPKYWRRPDELPPLQPADGVLKGLHIALDPGHIGGGYAKMEERWLQMNGEAPVMEGQLTLQVAQLLRPRLEALGAQVSFVRKEEAPVSTAKPDDFKAVAREVLAKAGIAQPVEDYAGMTGDEKIITVRWQSEKIFYRYSEIRARAKKVNEELKPDLVICLHLNAEEWGKPEHPVMITRNHFHLLVNGCYSPEELGLDDIRFELLERLFAHCQDEERQLGDVVATSMAEATGLPPFVYPNHNARRIDDNPYVWARNLLANRTFQCPVIYLEPYVMNNGETYERLIRGHWIGQTMINNQLMTSPLEDYTRGVVNGLVAYYAKARTRDTAAKPAPGP